METQQGSGNGPTMGDMMSPEQANQAYNNLLMKVNGLERNLHVLHQQVMSPMTMGRKVALGAAVVIGVSTISIVAVKTWDWAFPGDPKNKR